MRIFIIGILIWIPFSSVQAMPIGGQGKNMSRGITGPAVLDVRPLARTFEHLPLVAENTPESTTKEESGQPEAGTLVIPGEDEDKTEKKCLKVCKKWGENCIINPRTGNRDCRRTCKEFGTECF